MECHPIDIWLSERRSYLLDVKSGRYAYAADMDTWEATQESRLWVDQLVMPKTRREVSVAHVDSVFSVMMNRFQAARDTVAAIHGVVRDHVEGIENDPGYEGPAFPNLMLSGALASEFAKAVADALTPEDVTTIDPSTVGGLPLSDSLLRGLAKSPYAQVIVLTKPLSETGAETLEIQFFDLCETVPMFVEPFDVDISHVSWFCVLDAAVEDMPDALKSVCHQFRIEG